VILHEWANRTFVYLSPVARFSLISDETCYQGYHDLPLAWIGAMVRVRDAPWVSES